MSGARGPLSSDAASKLSYKVGPPKMPRGLSERGQEIYRITCRHLKTAGVLQVVDGAAVGKFAQWLAMWEKEVQTLNVEGAVVVPVIAGLESKINPRLMAVHKIDTMLSAAEKKLGFSPEDRMRIKGTSDKKKSRLGSLKDRVAKKAAKKAVRKPTGA